MTVKKRARTMQILEMINHWIEKAETALLVAVLSVMVVLAFMQVVLRNVFDQGILWGDVFLRHLVLWVGFLGASLATREEKHINIDLFARILKGRAKEISHLVTNLFAAVVCYFLADAGIAFVADEITYKTTIFNDIPAWYFQVIIPVGFALMAFRFLVLALKNLMMAFGRGEKV